MRCVRSSVSASGVATDKRLTKVTRHQSLWLVGLFPGGSPAYWWFRLDGMGTWVLRFVLNAAPLKAQNPASDPPANTDHKIVFVHPAYFSKPRLERSQKVRGQTMMRYTPKTAITAAKPATTATMPADKLSNKSMAQCWRVGSDLRAELSRDRFDTSPMVLPEG